MIDDLDATEIFWKCKTCAGCKERQIVAKLYLMLIFWDLDRLFSFGRFV